MFRAIKHHAYFLAFQSVCLVLGGCLLNSIIGPGYSVEIKLSANAKPKVRDITFLDDLVVAEGFGGKRVSSSHGRECVNYIKENPQIEFGYCYDSDEYSKEDPKTMNNFRVIISNSWKGQEFPVKDDIDRLSDTVYLELERRFGRQHLKQERRRTGPPV